MCPPRDVWLPLRERAGVRPLDMYSLRHTFASLGRTAGESSFNVSRVMGHSKSTLVDAVYAHSMQSGLSGVAESVTARALGLKRQLRVIEGGNCRDVGEALDDSSKKRRPARLQVLDVVMGRDGIEPSTSGLKVAPLPLQGSKRHIGTQTKSLNSETDNVVN